MTISQKKTYDGQDNPMNMKTISAGADDNSAKANQDDHKMNEKRLEQHKSPSDSRVSAELIAQTTPRNEKIFVQLLLLAIVTAISVGIIKDFQKPVVPRPAETVPTINYKSVVTEDIAHRIQIHADQANRRNLEALQLFEMEISRVMDKHESQLSQAARKAGKNASTYGSCCEIIYLLACDTLSGTDNATGYLNQQINPYMESALQDLSTDIESELIKLQYSLNRSTVQLAVDLAAINPRNTKGDLDINLDKMAEADVNQSLNNLGFNSIAISISAGFDVVAIAYSQTLRFIWTRLTAMAGRLFSTQVATVAASGGAVLIDGPLPIGDILAAAGLLWTAWDIYASQQQFENELTTALDNKLGEARHNIHAQTLEHARQIVEEYRNLQDGIGTQAVSITANERR